MISLIVAMSENRVIGRDNALPWRLPNDLRYFRKITMGHPIIMGRKNHESIGKALPGRTNIVVTRTRDYEAPGCIVRHTIDVALFAAGNAEEIFIIGGAQLYAQTLDKIQRFYLTLIHANVTGDTTFPEFDWNEWREISHTRHERDAEHDYPYSFITLERRTML